MNKLLLIFIFYIVLSLATNGKYPASELKNPVWPKPKSMILHDVTVFLDPNTFKFTSNLQSKDILNAFDRFNAQIFPHPKTKSNIPSDAIVIPSVNVEIKNDNVPLQHGVDESYTIDISSTAEPIKIVCSTVYGAYRALETLAQLVQYDFNEKTYKIYNAAISIVDAPFVGYRGLLIDTSRHYLSVDVIKKVIRSLTYAKMNVLHWHMVDDQSIPIQSIKYPDFWKGAYSKYERYTQVEVADIVEYARQRGVRIMIEYDVPGHGTSWCTGLPDICPSESCKTPLDLTKDFTYEFLDGFFSEMTNRKTGEGLFPETFFHLGGDEVDLKCYDTVSHIQSWLQQRSMSAHDGYLYIVNKTQHIIMDQGRDPVNWEEVWTNFKTKLDKRTIVHSWLTRTTFVETANLGYRSILSNYKVWYLDYLDTKWSTFYDNSLVDGIKSENYKYIMGGEVCMWAETVDVSDLFNTVWPRAAAAAERLWSNPTTRADDTENRLMNFRCYLHRQGIDAAPVTNARARQNPPHQDSCYIQ